jgi:alpha-tubulin suppressor-like RCC1 family protein
VKQFTCIVFLLILLAIAPGFALCNTTTVKSISSGTLHSLILLDDGTVYSCGYNANGQCGNGFAGDNVESYSRVPISNVTMISAGGFHSLALKDDGTVWAWGSNNYGQCGNDSVPAFYSPVRVEGISNVVMISAGPLFNLALKDDGTVWGWGYNYKGQLGDNILKKIVTPVQITGLSNIAKVFAEDGTSFAIDKQGSLWGWGNNIMEINGSQIIYGILDNDEINETRNPILVKDFTDVVSISFVGEHLFVIRKDGSVWAWGSAYNGRIGNNSANVKGLYDASVYVFDPVKVDGLKNVVQISCGSEHAIALEDDGTVWTWGSNDQGQVGRSGLFSTYIPGSVSLKGVKEISSGNSFCLALCNDGSVCAWGDNYYSEVGNGQHDLIVYNPVKVFTGQSQGNPGYVTQSPSPTQNSSGTINPSITPGEQGSDGIVASNLRLIGIVIMIIIGAGAIYVVYKRYIK